MSDFLKQGTAAFLLGGKGEEWVLSASERSKGEEKEGEEEKLGSLNEDLGKMENRKRSTRELNPEPPANYQAQKRLVFCAIAESKRERQTGKQTERK